MIWGINTEDTYNNCSLDEGCYYKITYNCSLIWGYYYRRHLQLFTDLGLLLQKKPTTVHWPGVIITEDTYNCSLTWGYYYRRHCNCSLIWVYYYRKNLQLFTYLGLSLQKTPTTVHWPGFIITEDVYNCSLTWSSYYRRHCSCSLTWCFH